MIVSFKRTFPERVAEWLLSVAMFLIGVTLLLVGERVFVMDPYAVIRTLIGSFPLGVLCIFVGGGRLTALAINGAMRRTPLARAILALVSTVIWMGLLLGFTTAGVPSMSMPFLVTAALFDFWNTYRAAADAGTEDREKQNGD